MNYIEIVTGVGYWIDKEVRSKLSVKVFLHIAVLLAVYCGIMYLFMIGFVPYVYWHDVAEVEEMVFELSLQLDKCWKDESKIYIEEMGRILAEQAEEYMLFASKNKEKESQVVEILKNCYQL